jgi:hypothetical protein
MAILQYQTPKQILVFIHWLVNQSPLAADGEKKLSTTTWRGLQRNSAILGHKEQDRKKASFEKGCLGLTSCNLNSF